MLNYGSSVVLNGWGLGHIGAVILMTGEFRNTGSPAILMTWELGNSGTPTIFSVWKPGNSGTPTSLNIWEPGNTGTPTIWNIWEPGNMFQSNLLSVGHVAGVSFLKTCTFPTFWTWLFLKQ